MVRIVFFFWIVMIFSVSSHAQVDYQMSIANGEIVNSNTYEFDIYIRSVGSSFVLSSYQCALTFNTDLVNSGSLSFSYVPGTSGLSNPPSVCVGVNSSDGNKELTFASMPGSDNISSTAIRVGRFRLQNTNPLGTANTSLMWNFVGNITTILTGNNFSEITNPLNHSNELINLVKHNVTGVFATGIADPTYGPEKTIDGMGFYDGDPNSRWAVQPMPQWITFDLGYEQRVCLSKLSFFNFQEGRVYQYSILLSNDSENWYEVVSNASSAPAEWTMDVFPTTSARYIRVDFLSSTNNPSSWANLWEAEIWGYITPTPVELVSFTGNVLNNKRVELKWTTATEINNKGFEIHRSSNGEDQVIGYVEGRGSSSEINNYSFIDEKGVKAGTYSYRLKQIDYDGSYEYSKEVKVEIEEQIKEYALLQNYPNPFNPVTKIRIQLPEESEVELRVYNSIGEQVAELVNGRLMRGSHEIEFNAGEVSSGIYFYQLKTGTYSQIKKMIVMK
jgi:hypothetical protein